MSIRAGRATSPSSCRTSGACPSRSTRACGSARSASSGCPARLSGPTGAPGSGRSTRVRASPPRRRSTVTSRPAAGRTRRRGTEGGFVALNDAVHWSADLGAGIRVALVQAGTFRSDAGALFGPVPRVLWGRLVADEIDADGRLLQALNCLLIETPAGRVLVETGIGERLDERGRTWRGLQGRPVVPALVTAGFDPASVDIVAMSHLHYDHAGGLLRADGSRAFPRARIVAQRAEWEIALDANPRIAASYDQPELRLVRAWGGGGAAD